MKYRYEEMSWPEVRQAVEHDPVVVLPVGTTEQHGYHLPLMVDYLCADEVARAAVERVAPRALLMHPVPYSFNEHHMDYPGTIAVDGHTVMDYVVCIGRSLAHHGFRRILLVNGHGSNVPFLDAAARLITIKTPAICALASWWTLLEPEDLAWREARFSSHGDAMDTSMLLHLRPELVDMSLAVDEVDGIQRSKNFLRGSGGSPVLFNEFFSRNTLSGVAGQPTLATPEKGARVFAAAAARLAELLDEF